MYNLTFVQIYLQYIKSFLQFSADVDIFTEKILNEKFFVQCLKEITIITIITIV